MTGSTQLLVKVDAVDVPRSRALLVLSTGQHIEASIANHKVAVLLRRKRGRTIAVSAQATWDSESLDLVYAQITGVGSYDLETADPVAACEKLRELSGGYWDTVDVDAWMDEMRGE